jgi:NAD(P)-dependent dehydrogenase (short-subunit alcohol dehydrogenase family)
LPGFICNGIVKGHILAMSRRPAYRILILGGYGHFGARIASALAASEGTEIVIAGRDPARARASADKLGQGAAAQFESVQLDVDSPQFRQMLRTLRADLVIHTAGPFQGQSYAVASSCIEVGAHYIDLADGRAFVSGITALDAKARERGVLVVSGASTVPALSSAVVDRYRDRFAAIESIDSGIVPGNRAPRGVSTIASVLSYCGQPLLRWQQGEWQTVFGWQDLHARKYSSLGRRWLASCDIPDLELFPRRYDVGRSVVFHAGLELSAMQFGLWLMSWLARSGLVGNWRPAAGFLKAASDWTMVLGSDDGGMHVEIKGHDAQGRRRSLLWTLIAHQSHGPEIPCVASIVIARKLIAAELRVTGAQPCMGLMTLDDFDATVENLDIHWTVAETNS